MTYLYVKGSRMTKPSREIIEDQVLAQLNDKSKVAICLTERELTLLIHSVASSIPVVDPKHRDEVKEFFTDILELCKQAFGTDLRRSHWKW